MRAAQIASHLSPAAWHRWVRERAARAMQFLREWQGGVWPAWPTWTRPHHCHAYGGYNGPWIEQRMLAYWRCHRHEVADWEYLPIYWTELRIKKAESKLKRRLAALLHARIQPERRYVTVVQHALGIPVALPGNVRVFSTSLGGEAIPLLKQPLERSRRQEPQPIPVSFIGQTEGYPDHRGIRSRMARALAATEGFVLQNNLDYETYCQLLRQSVFTLAPRGYGATSFRLYEAMAMRSIPVYLWQEECRLPFADELDWNRLALLVPADEVDRLPELLEACGLETRREMHAYTDQVYDDYFTYEGVCRQILKRLSAPAR